MVPLGMGDGAEDGRRGARAPGSRPEQDSAPAASAPPQDSSPPNPVDDAVKSLKGLFKF